MRIHIAAAVFAVGLGAYGGLDRDGWLWVMLSIAFVWSAECANSAIERVVDLTAGEERHPLAKAAKDMAAAAVLVAAAFALGVGCVVIAPAVVQRIGG